MVDDDLGTDRLFLDLLGTRFTKYDIIGFSNPSEAIKHLKGQRNIALCLLDLIYRSESSLSGVALMEKCIEEHYQVRMMTGHAIANLGIQVQELRKFGVKKSMILRKPATLGGYDTFFNKIEEALS